MVLSVNAKQFIISSIMKQFITAVLIILFLIACQSSTQQPAKEAPKSNTANETAATDAQAVTLTDEQFRNAAFTMAAPEIQPVNKLLKVNGHIEAPPENRQTISFPLGGYLKTNRLIPGMYVKKGALLATIEDVAFIQLQQDYLLSKSKLEYLEADYNRQQELNKTQSGSQRTLQQAKAEYESQRITNRALAEKLRLIGIDLDSLSESNLSRTVHIYAPIAGYITKVNVNAGKYVAPTDVLFELVNPSKTHISLTVFENDAAFLQRGQKVVCNIPAKGNIQIPATIKLITPDLNESRAVEVHCDFDNPVPDLLPGAFVNAEILLGHQPGYTLPNEAVVKWQNEHFIFTEAGPPKKYNMMKVEVGNSSNGRTEIKTSIPPGIKVVASNAYTLLTMIRNTPEEE
jgi:membrane fusion protein, heavy metal efflux system